MQAPPRSRKTLSCNQQHQGSYSRNYHYQKQAKLKQQSHPVGHLQLMHMSLAKTDSQGQLPLVETLNGTTVSAVEQQHQPELNSLAQQHAHMTQSVAAEAMVNTVRVMLVILIGVFLVKLRLLPAEPQRTKANGGGKGRARSLLASGLSRTLSGRPPPGPRGLPVLGYLPFMGQEIHLTLTDLSERYGPIYQLYLGGIRVVVLNDAQLVRQAFKEPVFSGRPDTQLTKILQGYGIINSDGDLWREQRAFLHSALRKLGAKSLMGGSNGLEAKIQSQVNEFVGDLKQHADLGEACQVRPMVARAVSSVIGSIVMNLTYSKEQQKFDRLIELMQEGFRLVAIAMPLDFLPMFRFVPGVSYAYRKIKRNKQETSAFFQAFADDHRQYLKKTFNIGVSAASQSRSLHPKGGELDGQEQEKSPKVALSSSSSRRGSHAPSPSFGSAQMQASEANVASSQSQDTNTTEVDSVVARDLVDAYLLQQKKHENDGKENYFSDKQLVQIMTDIFSAGLETVTSTIEWSVLFMILNPHCQRRVQQEIDTVVGKQRAAQLQDLSMMPYTEATIYEVLRRSNVVALGNAHATLDDATIGGYLIPKGTQVLPNLYGINMNSKLWQDPDKFEPERFIVNNKAHKPDHFIPFSVGRRVCLGDLLAKMEVFLFLVGILQKYDLSVAHEDCKTPPQVQNTLGLSSAPKSFRVALSCRA